jgi:microcystin-dependent protein
MSEPFIGQVSIVPYDFAPRGWTSCNGQLLPINQNQALFALLGTAYGGNGQTNFGVPDLRGRVAMGVSSAHPELGEKGGAESHVLTIAELPQHVHAPTASTAAGSTPVPGGNLLARMAPANPYAAPATLAALNPSTVASVGGSQAHENMQPYLTMHFVIALSGIFPSQN